MVHETLSWSDARHYCQEYHFDLLHLRYWDSFMSTRWSLHSDTSKYWIGLRRDPDQDTAWRWINLRTGVGLTGEDFSHSSKWATNEQTSHCAVVDNRQFSSLPCSTSLTFYCSKNTGEPTFNDSRLSWHEARQYCQQRSLDLATYNPQHMYKVPGWIGLYRVGGDHWNWSQGHSEDINWNKNEPLVKDCASYDPTKKKSYSRQCSEKLPFFCVDDGLLLVKKRMTWEEALDYCENLTMPCMDEQEPCMYRYKLLSLTSEADFDVVRHRIQTAGTSEVFVGLRFLAGTWWWMNGDAADSENLPECPTKGWDCGIISKNSTDNWLTGSCMQKRNFVCLKRTVAVEEDD
ncbi:macrophage mannose receptor 1-like [Synchiropus splendidus]|uniref:macrophage mannose receptor 1-like n=1 Tax=Synchiropus splendidus TaxID=270530 RepID=UPI00237D834F|nr:macrophage mannose receptor 1-like [Synchiropus splendidus]